MHHGPGKPTIPHGGKTGKSKRCAIGEELAEHRSINRNEAGRYKVSLIYDTRKLRREGNKAIVINKLQHKKFMMVFDDFQMLTFSWIVN